MGILGQLFQTAGENIAKSKDEREFEKEYVLNNVGSKAISEFIAFQFEKGNPFYIWLKKNKVGLYPVINDDSVSMCYMQYGDGQSFSGMIPKDREVGNYTFREMYTWYGLNSGEGYDKLWSRTQKNTLESMINGEVMKLSHIKFNNGYLVKAFH